MLDFEGGKTRVNKTNDRRMEEAQENTKGVFIGLFFGQGLGIKNTEIFFIKKPHKIVNVKMNTRFFLKSIPISFK